MWEPLELDSIGDAIFTSNLYSSLFIVLIKYSPNSKLLFLIFFIPASSTISSPVFTGINESTDGVPALNLFILSAGLYLFSKLKG